MVYYLLVVDPSSSVTSCASSGLYERGPSSARAGHGSGAGVAGVTSVDVVEAAVGGCEGVPARRETQRREVVDWKREGESLQVHVLPGPPTVTTCDFCKSLQKRPVGRCWYT